MVEAGGGEGQRQEKPLLGPAAPHAHARVAEQRRGRRRRQAAPPPGTGGCGDQGDEPRRDPHGLRERRQGVRLGANVALRHPPPAHVGTVPAREEDPQLGCGAQVPHSGTRRPPLLPAQRRRGRRLGPPPLRPVELPRPIFVGPLRLRPRLLQLPRPALDPPHRRPLGKGAEEGGESPGPYGAADAGEALRRRGGGCEAAAGGHGLCRRRDLRGLQRRLQRHCWRPRRHIRRLLRSTNSTAAQGGGRRNGDQGAAEGGGAELAAVGLFRAV